jgi:hypothetical protein
MTAGAHPAVRGQPPSREDPVGLGTLFFAVFGPPIAWFIQLNVNYALDSHRCFPHDAPRSDLLPGWEGVGTALLTINIAAILVALAAAVVSLRVWRATSKDHPPIDYEFLPPPVGRTRFLAICGTLTGFGFTAATIFNLAALLVVPTCPG